MQRLEAAGLSFGHGTCNARDEAAYLILHVLGVPLGQIADERARLLTDREHDRIERLVERRIRERLPAPYLTREAWLGEVRFLTDRRCIVPRSFIAELCRDRFAPWLRMPVRRALDLCTGSGCLAVLLARAFPRASVDASDVSAPALQVARRNVALHRLQSRIRIVRSDLFAALGAERYDLIISNPPYVTDASMRRLPPEYLHEPRRALAGGRDGLDIVRRILSDAARHLSARGMLVCEIGHNRRALEDAFPTLPFLWPDTSEGPDRVFMIERAALAQHVGASSRSTASTSARARRSGRIRAR